MQHLYKEIHVALAGNSDSQGKFTRKHENDDYKVLCAPEIYAKKILLFQASGLSH